MENYKILYEELLSKFEQLQKDYSELEKLSQDKIAAAVDEEVTFAPENIDYIDTTFGTIWLESVKSIHAEKDGVEETWINPNCYPNSFCNTISKYKFKNGSGITSTTSSSANSTWNYPMPETWR